MSECQLGLPHCARAEAAEAEVERLTAKLQAVRDEYAAALAARDRRIAEALRLLQWGRCADRRCTTTSCVLSWAATDALRGDA